MLVCVLLVLIAALSLPAVAAPTAASNGLICRALVLTSVAVRRRRNVKGGHQRGRVDLGGRPPRPPTDPDVRVKRIWLFIS